MSSHISVELGEDDWLENVDSHVESSYSWLFKREDSRILGPVGARVVFVKEGYLAQCAKLEVDATEPRWTSHHSRRLQALGYGFGPRHYSCPKRQDFVLSVAEFCVVREASYHVCSCPGDQNAYFVRLLLQREGIHGEGLPLVTSVDLHPNLDNGIFIVNRERYLEATRRRWKTKDAVAMWWFDLSDVAYGYWWHGRIAEVKAQRECEHPLHGSLWECLLVSWQAVNGANQNEISAVCPWEVERGKKPERRYWEEDDTQPTRISDLVDEDEGDDEEYVADSHHRHRRRGSNVAGSAGSIATRSRDTRPITMQALQTSRDHSSYFCGVCGDGGGLLICDGSCRRSFHAGCVPAAFHPAPEDTPSTPWFCPDCRNGYARCAVCKATGRAEDELFICRMGCCGLSYHPACLSSIQASCAFRLRKGSLDPARAVADPPNFVCPAHFCMSCHNSGDAMKMLRCWNCYHAYHSPRCLPLEHKRYKEHNTIGCPDCHWKQSNKQPTGVVFHANHLLSQVSGGSSQSATMAVDERLQPSMSEPAAKRHRLCQAECSSPPPHLLDSHTTDAAQAAEAQTAAPAAHVIDLTEAPDHSALGTYRPAGLNPARPAVLPINTIINVQTGESRELSGKNHFHFGAHAKGGGCDFMIPVVNIKFHSRLRVAEDGTVCMQYCTRDAAQRYPVRIMPANGMAGPSHAVDLPAQGMQLQSGTRIEVAQTFYLFQSRFPAVQ